MIAGQATGKIIVSRSLVRQYFPGEESGGQAMHVPAHNDKVDYEIVGVVARYAVAGRIKPAKPTMYFPMLEGSSNQALAVHTATDPLAVSRGGAEADCGARSWHCLFPT